MPLKLDVVNINQPIKFIYENIKKRLQKPSVVFEHDVMEILMSSDKKSKYNLKDFRKEFFTFSIKSKDDLFKYFFYFSMLLFAVIIPWLSLKTGVSEQEINSQHDAELLYNYYSRSDNTAASNPIFKTQPRTVDFLCCCVGKWFNIENIYALRHVVAAAFGWMIILLTGLFLMELFAWRAAFFGAIFLFVSPHFLGNAFFNLVDIPFAFFYLLGIFQIYLFTNELPTIRWRRLVYITLTILAANSIHVGGFVLLHYLFILALVAFVIYNPIKKILTRKYITNLGKLGAILVVICAIVYFFDFLYPVHILHFSGVTPVNALKKINENQILTSFLWNGKIISSEHLSIGFIYTMVQFTIPLVLLIGIITHFIFAKTIVRTLHWFKIILIVYVLIFPFFKLSGSELNLSDIWSAYLMVYPIIIIYAVAGYEGILRRIDDRYTNVIIVAAIYLLGFMPLRHVVMHRQHVSIYFSEISGGIHDNYGRYSIDPLEQSNKRVCNWFSSNYQKSNVWRNDSFPKIKVLTDGGAGCDWWFRNDTANIQLQHATFAERNNMDWDYFITFADKIPPQQLKNGSWEKEMAWHKFYVERKQIAAIIKKQRMDSIPMDSIVEMFNQTK